jgi:periplasmic protein TonB
MPHPAQRTAAPARIATQPHRLVAAPKSLATPDAGAGPDDQPSTPPGPAGPLATPSPTDYRYVVVSARFIHRVDPLYPQETIDGGDEGTVIVLLTIGPDGVSDVRVWESSGYPALDRAALQAAKESTYSVPEVNGEPVTETYRIIYTFALNS